MKTKDDRVVFERAVKHLFEKEDDGAACVFLTKATWYRAEGVIKDLWCQVSPFPARLLTGAHSQGFLRQSRQTQCASNYFGLVGFESARNQACRFCGTGTFSVLSGHRSATFNMVAHMFVRTMNMRAKADPHCQWPEKHIAICQEQALLVSPPSWIGSPKQQIENFAHRYFHPHV